MDDFGGYHYFWETPRWKRCRFFHPSKNAVTPLKLNSFLKNVSVTFQGAMMNKPGYQKISWQKWYKLWRRPRPTHPPPMKIVTFAVTFGGLRICISSYRRCGKSCVWETYWNVDVGEMQLQRHKKFNKKRTWVNWYWYKYAFLNFGVLKMSL